MLLLSETNGNYGYFYYNFIIFFPGICLFLRKKQSLVDDYGCEHFKDGCPKHPYTGATVYKCNSPYSPYSHLNVVDNSC